MQPRHWLISSEVRLGEVGVKPHPSKPQSEGHMHLQTCRISQKHLCEDTKKARPRTSLMVGLLLGGGKVPSLRATSPLLVDAVLSTSAVAWTGARPPVRGVGESSLAAGESSPAAPKVGSICSISAQSAVQAVRQLALPASMLSVHMVVLVWTCCHLYHLLAAHMGHATQQNERDERLRVYYHSHPLDSWSMCSDASATLLPRSPTLCERATQNMPGASAINERPWLQCGRGHT